MHALLPALASSTALFLAVSLNSSAAAAQGHGRPGPDARSAVERHERQVFVDVRTRGGPLDCVASDARRDGRGRRGPACPVILGGGWYGGEWALYNNRTFEPDSYNDWWHDRPDRAYPRWVTNGRCDRLYWSGGGWRC